MRTIAVIAALLLMGSEARAQNLYDKVTQPKQSPPATINPSDRSITVFDARFFDLDVEVPFLYSPRVVVPAEFAETAVRTQYRSGMTVVENCPVVQIAQGLYRHPETLTERRSCTRYGFVEEPSTMEKSIAAIKKSLPVLKRRRGQGDDK